MHEVTKIHVSVNFLLQGTMFVTDIKEENKSGTKTSQRKTMCVRLMMIG